MVETKRKKKEEGFSKWFEGDIRTEPSTMDHRKSWLITPNLSQASKLKDMWRHFQLPRIVQFHASKQNVAFSPTLPTIAI
jgi:hypothetical protein